MATSYTIAAKLDPDSIDGLGTCILVAAIVAADQDPYIGEMSDPEPDLRWNQFTLRQLLLGTLAIAILLGMGLHLGLFGITIVYDCWFAGFIALKCLRVRQIAGFRIRALSLLEWITLVALAFVVTQLATL